MHHILFIHSLVEKRLGYFHFLAIKASMNIVDQSSLWYEGAAFRYMPRRSIASWVLREIAYQFSEELPYWLLKWLYKFAVLSAMKECCPCNTSSIPLVWRLHSCAMEARFFFWVQIFGKKYTWFFVIKFNTCALLWK